jgi:hypothetical protein
MNKRKPTFACTVFIIIILQGCRNSTETQATEAILNNTGSISARSDNPTQLSVQVDETFTPQPTIDNSTPTPDLRIPAEQWKEWPIIPEITNHTIAIYASGIQAKVDSGSFSKIGDCQNIKDAFLGIYDLEGRYFLGEDEKEWQETIDNFKGYFNVDGMAIEQGLNVAAALSPLRADPDICKPSESPLQCELREANPSFAFISFERWWPNETPLEVYEKYLRIVIQTTMDHGTVPILITKADNVEGNHQINQIIAKLAFEFDIPLYNWWRAAQLLPHRGLDPERNDGFHISIKAWDKRSYYALETLDTLWKGLKNHQ